MFLFRNNLTPCTRMLSLGLSYLYPYNIFTECAILFSTCIFLKAYWTSMMSWVDFHQCRKTQLALTLSVTVLGISLWWKVRLWTRVTWQVTKSVLWLHRNLENALGGEQITKNLSTPPLNGNSKMRCHGINFYENIFKPFKTNLKKIFFCNTHGSVKLC